MDRRQFITAIAVAPVAASFAGAAFAAEPNVFASNGIAINGTDPVAYFTESKPVEGSSEFTAQYDGATWQFSSAENLATFEANPAAYAPQYGGYCAYAVSKGYTASTDPKAWTIHDGKLYLNYSRPVRLLWSRDVPGNIMKGDANWPTVLG